MAGERREDVGDVRGTRQRLDVVGAQHRQRFTLTGIGVAYDRGRGVGLLLQSLVLGEMGLVLLLEAGSVPCRQFRRSSHDPRPSRFAPPKNQKSNPQHNGRRQYGAGGQQGFCIQHQRLLRPFCGRWRSWRYGKRRRFQQESSLKGLGLDHKLIPRSALNPVTPATRS